MLKRFFYIMAFLLLACSSYAGPVIVTDADQPIPIGKHAEYFIDRSNKMSISEIMNSTQFIAHNDAILKFGFLTHALWIKFEIYNNSSEDLYLEFPNPHLDHIELYTVNNNKILVIKTGDYLPFSSKEIKHRHFVFTIKKSSGPVRYFIKMQSSGYLTCKPVIVSKNEFIRMDAFELSIIWFFFGIMAILAIYNLLVFVSVREKEYLYYALLNLAYAAHVLACKGLIFQYILPQHPEWHNLSSATLLLIVGIFTMQFSKYFLELKTNNIKLYHLINIEVITFSILLILIFIFKSAFLTSLLWIIYLITLVILTGYALFKAIHGSRSNMFYFLSGILSFLGIFLGALYTAKGVDLTYIINYFSLQVGGVFHTIFLSIGLADKINSMRKDLLDLNINLEKKVTEKTEELRVTIDELEVMNENLADINRELDFAHQTMQKDMDMAINVQTNILPLRPPQIKNWELAFHFQPMAGVSGDFYDFYTEDSTLLGLSLFDVSGHGISSGLITMIAKTIVYRNFINGQDTELNQVLENANKELRAEIASVNNYVTGIVLRMHDNNVHYVNAGHPDLFLKSGNTAYPVLNAQDESIASFFLGVENLAMPFEELTVQVNQGDFLIIFSDCLTESRNGNDIAYNTASLLQSLKQAPSSSAQALLDFILHDFFTFLGRTENLPDDLTVIVAKKI